MIIKSKEAAGREQEGVVVRRPVALLSEEPLAAFSSRITCAGSLGEEKQATSAYLPSISIGGNGKSWVAW